jgi:hypothetical protein
MFDLNLAHYHATERERDLATDLRDRRILKAAAQPATQAATTARLSATERPATRTRAYVR